MYKGYNKAWEGYPTDEVIGMLNIARNGALIFIISIVLILIFIGVWITR